MALNDIRSLHSLNGIEWQMRLSLSCPWTALPLNVIKGLVPECH